MYRQYVLASGGARRVGWIDHEPPLARGGVVELKDDARLWIVEMTGGATRDAAPEQAYQVCGVVGRVVLPNRS